MKNNPSVSVHLRVGPSSARSAGTDPPEMKPNLLVIQPSPSAADSAIDLFCESLSETHYVYLIRPLDAFREDSPAGVRFLNFSPAHLPGFGEVESIVLVDEADHAPRLEEQYPGARHWRMDSTSGPDFIIPGLSQPDTIISGDFGPPVYQKSRGHACAV